MTEPAQVDQLRPLLESCSRGRYLLATATLVLTADVLTKAWVLHSIPYGSYNPPWKTLIPGFLHLVHIGNSGAAFGMLQGFSWLLAALAIVALVAIYLFRRDLELHRRGIQIIFGLIIGGILGNFIDRVVHGEVIDFIDVHLPFALPWIGSRFPSFNIADSGITCGVGAYLLYSLLRKPPPVAADKEPTGSPPEKA